MSHLNSFHDLNICYIRFLNKFFNINYNRRQHKNITNIEVVFGGVQYKRSESSSLSFNSCCYGLFLSWINDNISELCCYRSNPRCLTSNRVVQVLQPRCLEWNKELKQFRRRSITLHTYISQRHNKFGMNPFINRMFIHKINNLPLQQRQP